MKTKRRLSEFGLLIAVSLFMLCMKVNYYIVIIVASLLIANFELARRQHLTSLGITSKRMWPAIKAQLPFTICGIAALVAFAAIRGYTLQNPGAGYLAYWLVSIPLQEFIFRGYAQSLLRDKLPVLQNVFLFSVVFSLVHHFASTPHTIILMLSTLVAGFAWGYAYEKEKNLIGPIFSHFILGSLLFLILPAYGI